MAVTLHSASQTWTRPSDGRHTAYTITRSIVENYRTRTQVFDASLPAQPGQFVMAWLPGADERPYSIASDSPLAITVAAVGPFSTALADLREGDRVWIRGPLGQGYHLHGNHVVVVGGGYGVAPLRFLAERAVSRGMRVTACIGARTSAEVMLADAFDRLGALVLVTTEDGSLGAPGRVTVAVERVLDAGRADVLCACGPSPMLEALEKLCILRDVPHQLSWEAHMRCGIGLCGSCELQVRSGAGWLTCLDGPVHHSRSGAP